MDIERIEDLTDKQVRALADAHVADFENKLRSPYARPSECEHYIRLWKNTKAKADGPDWLQKLTQAERDEIADALFCGDYDDLLKATR